jgi:hypothetical protein
MSLYFAVPLAILLSAMLAVVLAVLSVYLLGFLFKRSNGPDGIGAGVLVLLVALNLAVMTFVGLVTTLISLHHKTSWLTPTLAFAVCVVMARMLGPFDLQFAPFMLGTGASVWLISCWLLRTKESSPPENVI